MKDRISLSNELESITFKKGHSYGDEWESLHQPSNTGETDWTTNEVNDKVAELKEKGWKEKL